LFDPSALKGGIEKCKENIKVFEEAIQKEHDTIQEYRGMIDKIQEKEQIQKEALSRVEIDNGD